MLCRIFRSSNSMRTPCTLIHPKFWSHSPASEECLHLKGNKLSGSPARLSETPKGQTLPLLSTCLTEDALFCLPELQRSVGVRGWGDLIQACNKEGWFCISGTSKLKGCWGLDQEWWLSFFKIPVWTRSCRRKTKWRTSLLIQIFSWSSINTSPCPQAVKMVFPGGGVCVKCQTHPDSCNYKNQSQEQIKSTLNEAFSMLSKYCV